MNEEQPITDNKSAIGDFIEKAAPYIRVIIQNRKKLLIINGIVAVVSIALLFLVMKNYYDSTIVILPEYGGSSMMLGGLKSLAAVAGINVGEAVPTLIYQNLLLGDTVLEPVIYTKYKTKKFDHPVNLIDYYKIELDKTDESDPKFLQERDKYSQIFKIFNEDIMTTDFDRITNILTVTIRTKEQILSSEVANNLVASLDEYVRTKQKTNAKEQRIYIEKRTDQVKDSLGAAEEALRKFQDKNRLVSFPPQLLLEQTRLARNVDILQAVYLELTKQMEIVKLEEVKDAPIVDVREEAGIPIKKAVTKTVSIFYNYYVLFNYNFINVDNLPERDYISL